jgi:hypothetical protein
MWRLLLQALLWLRLWWLRLWWLRRYLLDMDARLGLGLHLLGRVYTSGTGISFG